MATLTPYKLNKLCNSKSSNLTDAENNQLIEYFQSKNIVVSNYFYA